MKEGINEGKLVQINGPEEGLIYGFEDSNDFNERKLFCISNWGANLNGIITWKEFEEHVNLFKDGIQYFSGFNSKSIAPPVEILKRILPVIVDWQDNHPGSKEHFGLKAMKQFINDLRDPSLKKQYTINYNCHPFFFQQGARYWQGEFFKSLAKKVNNSVMEQKLIQLGDLYKNTSKYMLKFYEGNIWEHWDDLDNREVLLNYIEKAYQNEKSTIEMIKSIIKFI